MQGASDRARSIEDGLRRRARWQDRYEWRIGTETTVTVERVQLEKWAPTVRYRPDAMPEYVGTEDAV